ncbi:MAG TPA: prepilin-type N-terminal cleavage/methylation domain-containing protein [Phycisphaerae bacterium]|nr:prepilin-type N-terminal cleavage/methylation domain-containing protein [Phycisphaerae bacterium]
MSTSIIRRVGFSLVELVIVVTIISIVAAIAVPRISRGVTGATEASLTGSLSTMRRAIEMYSAEHEGLLPLNKEDFVAQMTMYTDLSGAVNATKTADFRFGPYLKAIPPLPLGEYAGDARVIDGSSPGAKKDGGWWYDEDTGDIRANLKNDQVDETGTPYNQY